MSKKEIIILVVVGIFCFFFTYSIASSPKEEVKEDSNNIKEEVKKEETKKEESKEDVLKVGNYTLKYGAYKGLEPTENGDKEVTMVLTKNTINNETYTVKGSTLIVNNVALYEVTGDNKISLMAGSGIEYEYVG